MHKFEENVLPAGKQACIMGMHVVWVLYVSFRDCDITKIKMSVREKINTVLTSSHDMLYSASTNLHLEAILVICSGTFSTSSVSI